MSTRSETREDLIRLIGDLPDSAMERIAHYIAFLHWLEEREKRETAAKEEPPA